MLTLCDRWHKTPDQIYGMDASAVRTIRIAELGGYFEQQEEGVFGG